MYEKTLISTILDNKGELPEKWNGINKSVYTPLLDLGFDLISVAINTYGMKLNAPDRIPDGKDGSYMSLIVVDMFSGQMYEIADPTMNTSDPFKASISGFIEFYTNREEEMKKAKRHIEKFFFDNNLK